jgi:II/X family phage/plasmid replication protein
MIDWLSMVAPLHHSTPITGGHVVSIKSTGEVDWQCTKRTTVEGSFSTGLQVRTAEHESDQPCTHIEVSGNPVKFFQGHNLWGTDDLPALAIATLEHVAQALGIQPTEACRAAWGYGGIRLTRVDATESFHLPNRAAVLCWLRAAEQTAHLSHRGRGQLVKGSTLYFGKNSRRWSLKLYSKGQEINAKGHGQDAILSLPSAVEWADKTLRAELTLRSIELKRRGLSLVSDWFDVDGVSSAVTPELLRHALGAMTMTTISELDAEVLDTLRPALRAAVAAWEAGHDLRAMYSRSGFYKFRAELLPLGIDIATLMPKEVSNVVPLFRTLEAVPAPVPAWAVGTPLYFEPPRVLRRA